MRAADRSRRGWKGRRSLQSGSWGFTPISDSPFGGSRPGARGERGGPRWVRFIQQASETMGFPRVRVGIGRPEVGDEVTFVLHPFDEAEALLLPAPLIRPARAAEGGVG